MWVAALAALALAAACGALLVSFRVRATLHETLDALEAATTARRTLPDPHRTFGDP